MVTVRDSDSPAGSSLFFLALKKPFTVLPTPRELNTVNRAEGKAKHGSEAQIFILSTFART